MEQTEHAVDATVEGMEKPGWSNSPHAAHAPKDDLPKVQAETAPEPGFSNTKAVKAAQVEAKVVEPDKAEDKAEEPKKAPAKKTTTKAASKKAASPRASEKG